MKPLPILDEALRSFDEDEGEGRAHTNGHAAAGKAVHLDDFVAYLPKHNYVFLPTREPWPAASVNACIPPIEKGDEMIAASKWLDEHRAVEQMTWCPGLPMLIEDRLVAEGGWIERFGATILNLYRPPNLKLGNAEAATPWLDHIRRIYPDDFDHIVRWLAHRVQRPAEKINLPSSLEVSRASARTPC